eukprot:Gregarina_sp_Pseudo_9__1433@NODE_1960_length_1232_cov_1332_317687_g1711_i1_p1_GENE_NODE_1960_length_1232_cov_1332_317687_g1711_i1NODE_1960_length_1232_cov_1332_317687_g1711_i1_p1_ORF_typecomplete_len382_score77_93ADH_N/PF08240_12/3e30ADH_zinc_N/PF00107_26/4_4e17Glu_dehyd_C/PF16912_5/3_2e08AlaDh_PNT_C/PF01262_21/3_8e062Hacid_dh_C/PF02826_19/8_6e05ADH_zinc_N_2/PF13602_6/0_00031Shikimate_DH/PF01488_20/0_00068NAD_binding_2/PF03446_15/0_0027AdoHcyase_NAD/PF00670_21/0_071NAD_binding_10/PF13460_6/0_32P
MPIANIGIAAPAVNAPLAPWKYEVRDLREDDVKIEVHYCGMCHSDLHSVRDDWFPGMYPMVPGHEVVGVVSEVGSKVSKWKAGDRVGVGCLVGSCRDCKECKANLENYCNKRIGTYTDKMPDGEITYGGYGKWLVCQQDFLLRVPDSIPLEAAAPLLCAGITTYSPLMLNNAKRGGLKIGVVGFGGLGHMAVQWAHAMGNEVTVFTRTLSKRDAAMKLGASEMVSTLDQEAMAKYACTQDYILDTISAKKPIMDFVNLLTVDGVLITLGGTPTNEHMDLVTFPLILKRRSIQGSCIGGIKETQEMLNYAAEKGIKPWVEVIKGDYVNQAFERMHKSDVQFRFVIDIKGSLHEN